MQSVQGHTFLGVWSEIMPGDCFTEDILIYQALQVEKP